MARYALAMVLGLLVLVACVAVDQQDAQVAPASPPLPTNTNTLPLPVASPAPTDSGWIATQAGVEFRSLTVALGEQQPALQIVRLDPQQVRFAVGYAPDAPKSLAAWQAETAALAAINGGFFDEANRTTALLINGGVAVGESYDGRGGMFAIAPDGAISLRYLAEQPYATGEPLAEALQSWPMLVTNGEQVYTFEDGMRARRSVVALDSVGRVLLLATPNSTFTLRELAAWLAASDLEINAALNLDGGSSTGLYLESADIRERLDPFVPLPIVLLAFPR